MADLSSFTPKTDTLTFALKDPIALARGEEIPLLKDDGKEMTLTVYLPHSPQYKSVVHEQTQKRLHKLAKGKKGSTFTADDLEQMSSDLLVKTTKDWNIQIDGKSPKFSEAAARELYEKISWIKDQVSDAQNDLEAYLGN